MPDLLTDLADAARLSGLVVVELDGWKRNYSAGAFKPMGVLDHHTGSYDEVGDTSSDLAYAKWLAFTGRDLDGNGIKDPPLCNLALSAECVVYVCAAGNANHAGKAKATGPMPAAADGSSIYIGIEAYNSGTQGWASRGRDAAGREITQAEAYARLDAALCLFYGWPASHVRGHKETSVTGKWDPGGLDMDTLRAEVARLINGNKEDDMSWREPIAKWHPGDTVPDDTMPAGQQLNQARGYAQEAYNAARRAEAAVKALAAALGPQVQAAVEAALADAVVDVNVNVNTKEQQ